MRFVDEYRDPAAAQRVLAVITDLAGDDHFKFMEVCGGHTHTIYRHGIEHVLPGGVELVHGPGCPVCVIPMGRIDDAIAVAETPGLIFTTLRGHDAGAGRQRDAAGGQGPRGRRPHGLLAARCAADRGAEPGPEVVFFAIGFETTAPSTALTLLRARADGVTNFSGVLQPRDDRAAHQGHPRVTGPASRRLSRSGPRVHRGREPALPIRGRELRQAAGDRRLRAARHPPGAWPCSWPRSARAGARSRTSTPRVVRDGGNPRRPGGDGRGLRAPPPLRVAGPRLHLAERAASCGPSSPPGTPRCTTRCPASGWPTRRRASAARC